MAGFDKMTIEILADGTIKTTTDPISAANHDNAERFLKTIADLAGGETKRVKRTDPDAMKRAHHHDYDHAHGHSHDHVKANG
jgi:hypothetical protein